MNAELRNHIPDRLLRQEGTRDLRRWLHARGASMSLLELHEERKRRGIR